MTAPIEQEAALEQNAVNPPHEYMTPREVAELIRKPVSSLAVDRCQRRDHPPYLKIGRKILYNKSEVLAWLESHRVTPAGGAQ